MDRSNKIDQVQEQIQESIKKRVYFTSLRGVWGHGPEKFCGIFVLRDIFWCSLR